MHGRLLQSSFGGHLHMEPAWKQYLQQDFYRVVSTVTCIWNQPENNACSNASNYGIIKILHTPNLHEVTQPFIKPRFWVKVGMSRGWDTESILNRTACNPNWPHLKNCLCISRVLVAFSQAPFLEKSSFIVAYVNASGCAQVHNDLLGNVLFFLGMEKKTGSSLNIFVLWYQH